MKPVKYLMFGVIVAALVLTTAVLTVIWRDEAALRRPRDDVAAVHIVGVYSVDGGAEAPLPADGKLPLEGLHRVTVTGRLDRAVPANQSFIMRVDNLRVKLYLNGELLYSFGGEGTVPAYVRSAGNTWESFVSPGITPDDEVRIELENHYTTHVQITYQSFLRGLYAGNEASVVVDALRWGLPNMLVAFFLMCMGIVGLLFFLIMASARKPMLNVACFAILSACCGAWFFIDFNVQSYLIPMPVWSNSADTLIMALSGTFLLSYFAISLKNKWRTALLGGAVAWVVFLFAATVMQMTGLRDYYANSTVINILCAGTVVLLVAALVLEMVLHHGRESRSLLLSTLAICAGMAAELVFNYVQVYTYLIWIKLGFLVFILLQFYQVSQTVRRLIADNARVQTLAAQSREMSRTLAYQRLVNESMGGLYENIYEVDVTRNRAANDATALFFESMGGAPGATCDDSLRLIARHQIKEEFRQGYLDLLCTENVKRAFSDGIDLLRYDFQVSADGSNYYWMRITARIFFWQDDASIRMLTLRQNIDAEKRRELELYEKLQRDPMTGLYNKPATETLIGELLSTYHAVDRHHVFFILDIDDFKDINDSYGHASGDVVIRTFAETLRLRTQTADVIGRIGGDEFVVFGTLQNCKNLPRYAAQLASALRLRIPLDGSICEISASVGVAVAPEDGTDFETLYRNADAALYQTKSREKGGFSLFSKAETQNVS